MSRKHLRFVRPLDCAPSFLAAFRGMLALHPRFASAAHLDGG